MYTFDKTHLHWPSPIPTCRFKGSIGHRIITVESRTIGNTTSHLRPSQPSFRPKADDEHSETDNDDCGTPHEHQEPPAAGSDNDHDEDHADSPVDGHPSAVQASTLLGTPTLSSPARGSSTLSKITVQQGRVRKSAAAMYSLVLGSLDALQTCVVRVWHIAPLEVIGGALHFNHTSGWTPPQGGSVWQQGPGEQVGCDTGRWWLTPEADLSWTHILMKKHKTSLDTSGDCFKP